MPVPGRKKPRLSIALKHALLAGAMVGCMAAWLLGWDLARQQVTLTGAALLALSPLAAAAAGWFVGGHMVRPLRAVESVVEGAAEGQYEPIEVPRTGDEVQLVAESINRMLEAIRAAQGELREEKRALEDRMHERAEALSEATDRALAASRAKSDFLANISHELRTPMNGVLGMLELLLDGNPTSEQREHLLTARSCANALLALLNDLLDLSKIEAGKMLIERVAFDLRAVVHECVATLQAQAQRKGIVLRGTVADEVPARIEGDPLRIRQVLMNLLGNAVKFTSEGWVAVTVSAAGEELGIEVRDTGDGIPAEKLSTIFDAFVQADTSVSRKFGGTGLGLAITRKIVELHGGRVGVESELGQGTVFRVQLPLVSAAAPEEEVPAAALESMLSEQAAEPEAQDAPPPSANDAESTATKANILLVEDNDINQKLAISVLSRAGYNVRVAGDGASAIDKLREEPFDLVLMDIQMPEMDGIAATKKIREGDQSNDIPILALTAHAMSGDRERCLAAGMNDYVSKPVAPAHLLEVVKRHLEPPPVTAPKIDLMDEPVPMPERPVVDEEAAQRVVSGDMGLLHGMIHLFLELAPERIDGLRTAAIRSDWVALRSQAMKLARAADRVAAASVGDAVRVLTQSGPEQNYGEWQQQLDALDREVARLRRYADDLPEAAMTASMRR